MTISPGAKFPTGAYKDFTPEGVKLSRDVQSGTGAYSAIIEYSCRVKFSDKFSIAASTNFAYNGINPEQYQYGYGNTNSIFTGIKFLKHFTFLAMIENENIANDYFYDVKFEATGYIRVSGTPGISYEFPNEWTVSALCELPIYQKFNGIQFVSKYSFTATVSKEFDLERKNRSRVQ
jgi:hypothetical protein